MMMICIAVAWAKGGKNGGEVSTKKKKKKSVIRYFYLLRGFKKGNERI